LNKTSPIGVFDSGIGGLTIVREIMRTIPHENVIYFGDIARLPYGTKSAAAIKKFTAQTVQFLLKQEVKAIVIACNTITSVALDVVKELAGNIAVIDVISEGSHAATAALDSNRIGIIATPVTINSHAYPKAIHELNPDLEVISQACPLFVPLIEEGLIRHKALELIAYDYLQLLIHQHIDTLILGCTHYPLIKDTLAKIIGDKVKIIDPAIATCHKLATILKEQQLQNVSHKNPEYLYFVTDIPVKFQEIGEQFLNSKMTNLELVNLD
jgi:glutamate racemase